MFDSYTNPYVVAQAEENVRAGFIRKTYAHLAAAIMVFAGLEVILFSIPGLDMKVLGMLATSPYSWLVVLGVFMAVSWIADKWAQSTTNLGMQYAGLGLGVVAYAVIFFPLLIIAADMAGDFSLIAKAGYITLGLFLGLTAIAFTTKKDFSFLGGILKVGMFVALGIIVIGIIGGFNLGLWFAGGMVLLCAGMILYTTSNIIHHYGTNQHVAASLALFGSVATLFWYILRIVMIFANRD